MLLRIVLLACVACTLYAGPPLDEVLARMDTTASSWQGLRAELEWVRYMALVDESRVESGRIAVRRAKNGDVEMLASFQQPSPYFLAVRGDKAERYNPKSKTVEEYDLGGSREKVENALMLGFGTSGSYLTKHYEVTLKGEERIAGQPAVRLELKPKDPEGELNNRPLEMWVGTEIWQPVQYKVYDLSPGDYRIYSYSEVQVNPSFKDSEFKLRLERGTKRARPQL